MPTKKPKEKGLLGMNTPAVVSPKEWEDARQQMLVKEKAQMRARDALVADRRRMPWMAVKASSVSHPCKQRPQARHSSLLPRWTPASRSSLQQRSPFPADRHHTRAKGDTHDD